ncbi:MAG: FIST C-terminal domain-containing protein [Deltaproteobacteria bacterium]|nr:FIST C-terminal domain-containing protein [Deltaproteobacteria bacterium]
MPTTVASALSKGTAREAAASLAKDLSQKLGGAKPAFAIAFASTAQPLDQLMPALREALGAPVWLGISTAGEFTEGGDVKGAVAALAVAGDYAVRAGMGKNLKADPVGAVTTAAAALPASLPGYAHRTVLMLVDPLSGRGEEAVLVAAGILGDSARLAGGAAGDDLAMKSTHVALDGTVASDAVVLAAIYSHKPLGVGVQHGHLPVSRPLKVTKASGSTVSTIEGRPAWDVWVEATKDAATKAGIDANKLPAADVGAFLLRYEAGLATGSTFKIRAPLSKAADGSLSFACGVPEGSVIQITESEPGRQVSSAREAARRARAQMGGGACAGAIVFDCICRNLILGNRFADAVSAMGSELGGAPFAGFETYGEIALDAGELSGFHNTTTVVLTFPRD